MPLLSGSKPGCPEKALWVPPILEVGVYIIVTCSQVCRESKRLRNIALTYLVRSYITTSSVTT